ncbi:MAG TPA: hypothetical protein VKT70_15275, partial [Stellaceae bacterium]|nr:hypothetical protein [Stellaceae bacterium]
MTRQLGIAALAGIVGMGLGVLVVWLIVAGSTSISDHWLFGAGMFPVAGIAIGAIVPGRVLK